jgi:ferrous iron transport protein B
LLTEQMPDTILRSLLVDGIVAGVGSVLVFLPQILILFLFILALEDSGYLPRAAFLLDRLMGTVGLSGRSFIPLLSSFACAIPGIMAARTISNWRDRLATIMIAPLMTCSARLPVYALIIGAFIPESTVAGVFNLQGLVLFVLYVAGVVSAMAVAGVLKLTVAKGLQHPLMLELPSYRWPHGRNLLMGLLERARIFIMRVGNIILSLMVVLWFLSSFPAAPDGAVGPAIQYSYAGMLGQALEVIFAPIGFNWQISIALVPGMAAGRSPSARSARSMRYPRPVMTWPNNWRRCWPPAGRCRRLTRSSPGTSSRRNACPRWRSSSARPTRGVTRC